MVIQNNFISLIVTRKADSVVPKTVCGVNCINICKMDDI